MRLTLLLPALMVGCDIEPAPEVSAADLDVLQGQITALTEQLATAQADLADCAKADDLAAYALKIDLDPYVTEAEQSATLDGYATDADLEGLRTDVEALELTSDGHESRLVELEQRLPSADLLEELTDLTDFLEVDIVGEEVRFVGANVMVQDGSGDTPARNGLGNLIIGYGDASGTPDRNGSHNLILGDDKAWPDSSQVLTDAIYADGAVMAGRYQGHDLSLFTSSTLEFDGVDGIEQELLRVENGSTWLVTLGRGAGPSVGAYGGTWIVQLKRGGPCEVTALTATALGTVECKPPSSDLLFPIVYIPDTSAPAISHALKLADGR